MATVAVARNGPKSTAVDLSSVPLQAHQSSANEHRQAHVKVLCLDLNKASPTMQMVVCAGAVFVFYISYGYLQEKIFRVPGFAEFGWYMTLLQFVVYALLAYAESMITQRHVERKCVHAHTRYRIAGRRIPMRQYVMLSLYTVGTMGLSNAAVGYLNYPTQVIFKCCKLVPVLIGGVLIQGKQFGVADVAAAFCMSIGLVFFSLADSKVSPNFNGKGYVLICGALVFDAIIGNVQEKQMKKYGATNNEMVLYSYGMGAIFIFAGTVGSGELFDATAFCVRQPQQVAYMLVWSLAGYLGVNVVLTLVQRFGALIAVTVTNCRKAVTIVLSFVFFSKPFTSQSVIARTRTHTQCTYPRYIWAGLVVLLGIYLNVYAKNQERWNAQAVGAMQAVLKCYQQLQLRRSRWRKHEPLVESV